MRLFSATLSDGSASCWRRLALKLMYKLAQINVSSEDRSKSKILAESRTLAWHRNGPCDYPSCMRFLKWTTPAREASEAGIETCGAAGDFLNWEEADWTLHSKARIIEVDSARGPCRKEGKIQVY